ncbi:alpha/beta fold hydrolase [Zafaria sp. J156]|uniref:alpha/beta fold hydrolase n=1 Tax=Zafaria sp. J156 TaxID=3116490 RepID=UPI002E78B6AC|nr:alpha/beta hydrolase [Zafaria sp. J156]MEE1622080.1 alpha/beta hydrolase [Zafaria sp. J156]
MARSRILRTTWWVPAAAGAEPAPAGPGGGPGTREEPVPTAPGRLPDPEYDAGALLEVHTHLPRGTAAARGLPAAREPDWAWEPGSAQGPHALREAGSAGEPGPGVVLVHGTLVTDAVYALFCRRLAARIGAPVHSYHRRGRGGSAPQGPGYGLATEAADLARVLRATGARTVFGHSYGGAVALAAGLRTPELIDRLATFDAALDLDGSLARLWRPELEEATDAGRLDEAWALLVKGLGTAGPVSRLPLGSLRVMSLLSAKTRLGGEMRSLLPTAVREMRAVLDAPVPHESLRRLPPGALLLTGQYSPAYFARSARLIAACAPGATAETVRGHLHDGPIRASGLLLRRIARFHEGR